VIAPLSRGVLTVPAFVSTVPVTVAACALTDVVAINAEASKILFKFVILFPYFC
jgi:hypothetical protein